MTPSDEQVRLRPVTRTEFPEWVAASRAGYALGIESHGGQTQEEARRKAEADTAAALPQGFDTPGQSFSVIEADGSPVGRLWLGEREINGPRALFVYDIAIDEPFRGRGYGRAAMRRAEDEARGRGFRRLELHVFGGNRVARRLYRSLGYAETSVRMAKDLEVP